MAPLRICVEQMSEFEAKRKRYQVTALAGSRRRVEKIGDVSHEHDT